MTDEVDWSLVKQTSDAFYEAYNNMLAVRAKYRAGTKRVRVADKAWEASKRALDAAIDAQKNAEDEPRWRTYQRFYADTVVPKKKGGRR